MDTHFLKLLVCPLCNSPLRHDQNEQELVCQYDKLAYPIRNGIPIMLQEEARSLSQPHGAAAATSRSQEARPNAPTAAPASRQTDSKSASGDSSVAASPDSKH